MSSNECYKISTEEMYMKNAQGSIPEQKSPQPREYTVIMIHQKYF